MTPTLDTPRLTLRPLELADAETTQQLFPHWKIVRYLNPRVPWPYPPDGAHCFYRDVVLPAIARGDEWHWSLRLKSDPDQMIGSIGLFRNETDNRGFWIGQPWQRQGLMTEACRAVNAFWFDTLGFTVLRVSKAAPNVGSRRLSQREGMRLTGWEDRDAVSGRFRTEFWEITAEEWRRRQSSTPASNEL